MEGIASGLAYLHDREVVHGDLKGVRIFLELTAPQPSLMLVDP